MYFSKKMIDIQLIVTNGVITFSSCRVRSIGTYPARNLNKNRANGAKCLLFNGRAKALLFRV